MRKIIIAFAVVMAAGLALAAEEADVMAPVHQFIDATNKGDTKTALAACAVPASILDEFPPYAWQGATACSDWATDFGAFNDQNGITDPVATLGKPTHVGVTGDRAYVVIPATYTYKQNGKPVTESGSIMTVALQKVAAGWRITGWAWAKH
jgi:hypothetical protein